MSDWIPWKLRIRYTVALCVVSSWRGGGYTYARDKRGRIVKFWTRKAAQLHADKCNELDQRYCPLHSDHALKDTP